MKIRRITIKSYRGIAERDIAVPPNGAIARGKNGAGKTSILKAIKAALLAQDVGADAIRHGADKAEILVDTDDVSVKRVITQRGQRLEVTRDGMAAKAPQTFLTELLGTSSLDPMDLLLLKGKERRAKVLAALPVHVTVEQLRSWWPKCPDTYDVSGHGLEVIAKIRDAAYAKRTEANRTAKDTAEALRRASEQASALASQAPAELPDVDAANTKADEARAAYVALKARAEQAEAQAQKTAAQRESIANLREVAAKTRREAPERKNTTEAEAKAQAIRDRMRAIEERIEQAQQELREARDEHDDACNALQSLRNVNDRVEAAERFAAAQDEKATELEAVLSASTVEPVSADELERADDQVGKAAATLLDATERARMHHEAQAARRIADEARTKADAARAEAERLDGIVRALTEDAPATLLAAADGIPGLSLDGEDVLLDGVRLDALCGAEQVRFCVEVARRANAKSKILIVDGLERLDPESMDVFVREATRDGWQLLATRVDRGEVVIEAIEPDALKVEAA